MSTVPINLAVLFADVSGSTRLYEKLGDARALECIDLCVNIMREVTAEHQGRVIRMTGDGVLCVFNTVLAAVEAATDMQSRMSIQEPFDGEPLEIRIGLQFGAVLEQANDVFGDCVNVAARMTALAKPGQIITTEQFVAEMPASLTALSRHLDTLPVKGKEEDIDICEIIWEQNEEMTALSTRLETKSRFQARLRLRHGGREFILGPERKQITFGRDAASDLVIADRKASRKHARIEWRRDKYVLIDESSNGTHLTVHGQPEVRLRREEAVLHGSGSISFGHSYTADPTEVVAFVVEG